MSQSEVMTQNWLMLKPQFKGVWVTVLFNLVIILISYLNWTQSSVHLKASADLVFIQHQYLKLWTTLFVHSDFSHLLSNLILFIPLMYLVSTYYGSRILPFVAVLNGGVINGLVLQTLKPEVYLIGISGVVEWLAAFWLVLYYLIDLRENKRRRFAVVLFVTCVLFVPETYQPEVSYLSHFIGYLLGALSAILFYFLKKSQFKKAEIFEKRIEDDLLNPIETLNTTI